MEGQPCTYVGILLPFNVYHSPVMDDSPSPSSLAWGKSTQLEYKNGDERNIFAIEMQQPSPWRSPECMHTTIQTSVHKAYFLGDFLHHVHNMATISG